MKIRDGFKDIPKSKNDLEYKNYLKSCLTKRAYERKEDAVSAASKLGNDKKTKTQIYFCNFCGKYHVTTHCYSTKCGDHHNMQVSDRNGNTIKKAIRIMTESKRESEKVNNSSWF